MLLMIIASLYFLFDPMESHFFPKCPFHEVTGLYCPGCGSQRALHQLLHFDFVGVLKYNILFLVGLLVVSYNIVITIVNKYTQKEYYNYLYHPYTPIVTLIFIVIFWILRNIEMYPYVLLAPS